MSRPRHNLSGGYWRCTRKWLNRMERKGEKREIFLFSWQTIHEWTNDYETAWRTGCLGPVSHIALTARRPNWNNYDSSILGIAIVKLTWINNCRFLWHSVFDGIPHTISTFFFHFRLAIQRGTVQSNIISLQNLCQSNQFFSFSFSLSLFISLYSFVFRFPLKFAIFPKQNVFQAQWNWR